MSLAGTGRGKLNQSVGDKPGDFDGIGNGCLMDQESSQIENY